MNRHTEIYGLSAAGEHHSLARYLAHCTSCSPDDAAAILNSASAGGRISLPPLASWAAEHPNAQREAAAHREHLRTLYGDRLDTSAAEAAPVASGVGTTAVADGWAEAFGKTNARRADEQPQEVAATSMRQAMDEAIARLKGDALGS